MVQKVIQIGTSAGVTIPKKSLAGLGIKIGDPIDVVVNQKTRTVTIAPFETVTADQKRTAKLTLNFVNRYRTALENLAKK